MARDMAREREFFIDNLLVRIHCIIVMIRWTGLAPWEFEFAFPGSLISTFLATGPPTTHAPLPHLLSSLPTHASSDAAGGIFKDPRIRGEVDEGRCGLGCTKGREIDRFT